MLYGVILLFSIGPDHELFPDGTNTLLVPMTYRHFDPREPTSVQLESKHDTLSLHDPGKINSGDLNTDLEMGGYILHTTFRMCFLYW